MSYGSVGGINAKFGTINVTVWADLDNDANAGKIAAREAVALAYADAEIDAALRDTHYRKPLATIAAAVPVIIADIANALAGCWLKDARGQDTYDKDGSPQDSLTWHRTKAYQDLSRIKSGEITLDAL
jgi:phage gp36-like protein